MLPSRPTRKRVSRTALPQGMLANVLFRVHDIDTQGLQSTPIGYYDFLQNRVMIIFRPKVDEGDPEFNLVLSKKHNYDTVSL